MHYQNLEKLKHLRLFGMVRALEELQNLTDRSQLDFTDQLALLIDREATDRANAARRFMQQEGLGKDQVSQVRGFADQRLRKPDNPLDASNRRITLIVQYVAKEKDETEPAPASSPEETKPTAPEAGKPEH